MFKKLLVLECFLRTFPVDEFIDTTHYACTSALSFQIFSSEPCNSSAHFLWCQALWGFLTTNALDSSSGMTISCIPEVGKSSSALFSSSSVFKCCYIIACFHWARFSSENLFLKLSSLFLTMLADISSDVSSMPSESDHSYFSFWLACDSYYSSYSSTRIRYSNLAHMSS